MAEEETSKFTEEDRVNAQFASEFMHIMANAMTSKCLSRCIKKPGVKLERSEETCLVKCQDAFLETWNTTSTAVNKLRQKIAQEMAGRHRSDGDTPLD